MRIMGPNCLGLMSPSGRDECDLCRDDGAARAMSRLSARGVHCARRFSIGAFKEKVGFSAFVSLGSMLDVGWGDLIDYLGDDPQTKSI